MKPTSILAVTLAITFYVSIILSTGCCRQPADIPGAESAAAATPAVQRLNLPHGYFPYSFTNDPFLHPAIINDMNVMASDGCDQVTEISLTGSQPSNRYYKEFTVTRHDLGHPSVTVGSVDNDGYEIFRGGYQYIGMTDSGVQVLLAWQNYGGSGIWYDLLFLTVESEPSGIHFTWNDPVVRRGRETLLLKKMGQIHLGDRWMGELRVDGNALFVGKDTGWAARMGYTEDEWSGQDQIILIDLDW